MSAQESAVKPAVGNILATLGDMVNNKPFPCPRCGKETPGQELMASKYTMCNACTVEHQEYLDATEVCRGCLTRKVCPITEMTLPFCSDECRDAYNDNLAHNKRRREAWNRGNLTQCEYKVADKTPLLLIPTLEDEGKEPNSMFNAYSEGIAVDTGWSDISGLYIIPWESIIPVMEQYKIGKYGDE